MHPYDPKNLQNARQNRRARNATKQEAVLWHLFLKSCEVNFSRQYRIDRYILDFYAPSLRLAIEIDGGQHYEAAAIEYDEKRTAFLNERGVFVLRFTNTEIDKNLKGVVIEIKRVIRKRKEEGRG